jgi:hypothetical protein
MHKKISNIDEKFSKYIEIQKKMETPEIKKLNKLNFKKW